MKGRDFRKAALALFKLPDSYHFQVAWGGEYEGYAPHPKRTLRKEWVTLGEMFIIKQVEPLNN